VPIFCSRFLGERHDSVPRIPESEIPSAVLQNHEVIQALLLNGLDESISIGI